MRNRGKSSSLVGRGGVVPVGGSMIFSESADRISIPALDLRVVV